MHTVEVIIINYLTFITMQSGQREGLNIPCHMKSNVQALMEG